MLEPGGEADLALEPFAAGVGGELGQEGLEGDRAVVAEVAREIDDPHAAAAKLAFDQVALGERLADCLRHSHARALKLEDPGWNPRPCLLSRGRRATQHPPVQPDDHAHEADQPEPGGEDETFGHERDRRVGREADDQAGVDHAPDALAHDQS